MVPAVGDSGELFQIGLELRLLDQRTDLRLAVPHATFALAETRWGVIPTGGSHVRLPQQIPWAVAMELLITKLEEVEKIDDFLKRFEVDPEA